MDMRYKYLSINERLIYWHTKTALMKLEVIMLFEKIPFHQSLKIQEAMINLRDIYSLLNRENNIRGQKQIRSQVIRRRNP